MKKKKFVVFSHRIQNFGRVLPKKKELSQIVGGGHHVVNKISLHFWMIQTTLKKKN